MRTSLKQGIGGWKEVEREGEDRVTFKENSMSYIVYIMQEYKIGGREWNVHNSALLFLCNWPGILLCIWKAHQLQQLMGFMQNQVPGCALPHCMACLIDFENV
jgi:hypothetical protein